MNIKREASFSNVYWKKVTPIQFLKLAEISVKNDAYGGYKQISIFIRGMYVK